MSERKVDSYSDGMYGWWEIRQGERCVRVSWSVDHPRFQSQEAARDEAERRWREHGGDADVE